MSLHNLELKKNVVFIGTTLLLFCSNTEVTNHAFKKNAIFHGNSLFGFFVDSILTVEIRQVRWICLSPGRTETFLA